MISRAKTGPLWHQTEATNHDVCVFVAEREVLVQEEIYNTISYGLMGASVGVGLGVCFCRRLRT